VYIGFTVVQPPSGFTVQPTIHKMCVGLGPASGDTFAKAVEIGLAHPRRSITLL
jgi:hypothetical protein